VVMIPGDSDRLPQNTQRVLMRKRAKRANVCLCTVGWERAHKD